MSLRVHVLPVVVSVEMLTAEAARGRVVIDLDQAFRAVGAVAVVTNGWSDESIEATASELATECSDPDALLTAAKNIAHSWTPRHRPSLAVFFDEYRNEIRRRAMLNSRRSLPSADRVVPASEGLKIAAASYAVECERQGREPNWTRFRRFASAVGKDRS